MARSTILAGLFLALSAGVFGVAACESVEDFPGDAPAPTDEGGTVDASSDGGSFGDESPAAIGTYQWQWVNPSPTGRALYGIGGTSETDVWVSGEGGTVSHWNGSAWDVRHLGPDSARYFAVGTVKKDDVWVAGVSNDRIDVVHYDGKNWTESYPFSGSAFGGFSHGPGARLFAFVDYDILELDVAAATWKRTDTSANGVFGPPADLWVMANGEAWALTSGTKIMHLPAGSTTWELLGPLPGFPTNAAGLSLAGSGSKLCAFYTSRLATGGAGLITYDGTWHVGPASTDSFSIDTTPHGSLSACFADGSALMTYDGFIVLASTTLAPEAHLPTDFQYEKLYGAWSPGNATSKAFTIGAPGAFVAHSSATTAGTEADGTLRKDLLAVDVGMDGTVMLVDAFQPDRTFGGDVLAWKANALTPAAAGGFAAPPSPVGLATIAANDTWVLTNDNGGVGVAHLQNGSFGVTQMLSASGTPLAIFASAKSDIWVTAADHHAWHYDGSAWKELTVDATYASVHGSAANDVWFAGDAVAHWDGKTLTRMTNAALKGPFSGVWSSASSRVWLWSDAAALLWDGKTATPIAKALGGSAEWVTTGIAEAATGDVFVLTKRATGTALLWFDPTHTKLVEQVSSDLELSVIRGRGSELWAVGAGGAALRFAPPPVK